MLRWNPGLPPLIPGVIGVSKPLCSGLRYDWLAAVALIFGSAIREGFLLSVGALVCIKGVSPFRRCVSGSGLSLALYCRKVKGLLKFGMRLFGGLSAL